MLPADASPQDANQAPAQSSTPQTNVSRQREFDAIMEGARQNRLNMERKKASGFEALKMTESTTDDSMQKTTNSDEALDGNLPQRTAVDLRGEASQSGKDASPAIINRVSSGVKSTSMRDLSPHTAEEDALNDAIKSASKDVVRNATTKHWRKTVIGDVHTESFLARAILKHSKQRASILASILADYGDDILDLADDDFLDTAMRRRLPEIKPTELVAMLAGARRLGYEVDDLVDDDTVQAQTRNLLMSQSHSNTVVQKPSYRASTEAIENARRQQILVLEEQRNKARAALPAQAQNPLSTSSGPPLPSNTSTDGPPPKYQCPYCHKVFSQSGGLAYHAKKQVCMKNVGAVPDASKYKAWCNNCGKGFTTAYSFKMHQEKDVCSKAAINHNQSPPTTRPLEYQQVSLPHEEGQQPITVTGQTPSSAQMFRTSYQDPQPQPGVTRTPLVSAPVHQSDGTAASEKSSRRGSTHSPQLATGPLSQSQRANLPVHNASMQHLAPSTPLARYEPLKRKRSSLGLASTVVPPGEAQTSNAASSIVVAIASKKPTSAHEGDDTNPMTPEGKVLPEDIDPEKRAEMEAQLAEEAVRLERKIGELDKNSGEYEKLARQYSLTSATRKSQIRKNFGVRLRIRGPNKNSDTRSRKPSKRSKDGTAPPTYKSSKIAHTEVAPSRIDSHEMSDSKRIKLEGQSNDHAESSPRSNLPGTQSPEQDSDSLAGTMRSSAEAEGLEVQVTAHDRSDRSHSPLEVVSSTATTFAPRPRASTTKRRSETPDEIDSDDSSDSSSDGDIPARLTPGSSARAKPRFTPLYSAE